MADAIFIPDIVIEDEGGIGGKHPNRFVLPLLTAPTHPDKPKAFNTLRHSLTTVACKDVPDAHFEFDSSFVLPEAAKAFVTLGKIVFSHDGCPLAIWGHADPEGNTVYNKWLSERRAEAVYALLIRDTAIWERLYSHTDGAPGDVWGDKAVRKALSALGFDYDEAAKETLKDAIKRFQTKNGDAKPSGTNDAKLRKDVFFQYMQLICRNKDGLPYALSKRDFLGQGEGKHGAFQGCSEFNPQMILAKAEADHYKKLPQKEGKEQRHAANRDNRRVMIFLFAKGTKLDPDPKKWPCPRAKDGIQRCVDHLWSDVDHKIESPNPNDRINKQYPYRRRRFGKQVRDEIERLSHPEMTFGCRFYHALALRSPCERDLQMYALRVLTDGPTEPGTPRDRRLIPIPNARFAAKLGTAAQSAVVRGITTQTGMISIPYLGPQVHMELRLDVAGLVSGASGVPLSPDVLDVDVAVLPTPPDGQSGSADSDQYAGEEAFRRLTLGPDTLRRILKGKDKPLQPDQPPPPPAPPEPRPAGMPEGQSSLEPDADEEPVTEKERDLGVRQRLYNLGYGSAPVEKWTPDELKENVRQFQRDHAPPLEVTGTINEGTLYVLCLEYGS
jgi:hypothetical protein